MLIYRTNKILQTLTLIFVASVLHGCSIPTRAPICKEGEFEFPPGIEGRYRYSILGKNTGMSGAFSNLEDIEFEINESGDHYVFDVFGKGNQKLGVPTSQGQKIIGKSLRLSESDGSILPLSSCRIGDNYYVQQRNDDSTYMISRMDISSTGLTMSPLAWNTDTLKANGFAYYTFPVFQNLTQDGKFYFGELTGGVQIIIENSDLTTDERERLINLGHTTVAGYVLSRIPDEEKKHSKKARRLFLNKTR